MSSIGFFTALLLVIPALGADYAGTDLRSAAIAAVIGLATAFIVPTVGSSVRPLPATMAPEDAARVSAAVLRTALTVRFALAEFPALAGLVLTFLGASAWPYAVGYLFSVVLLVLMAYPRERVIAPVRDRLEASGTKSQL